MPNSSFISQLTENPPEHGSSEVAADCRYETVDRCQDPSVDEQSVSNEKRVRTTILIVSSVDRHVHEIQSRLSAIELDQEVATSEGGDAIDVVDRVRPALVLIDDDLPSRVIVLAAMNSAQTEYQASMLSFAVDVATTDSGGPVVHVDELPSSGTASRELIARVRDALTNPDHAAPPVSAAENDRGHVMRERRYVVPTAKDLEATISLDIGGQDTEVPVRIRDLSCSGAKFELSLPLTPGTVVTLRLPDTDRGEGFAVAGEVRWCQPCSDKSCRVGCRFDASVSSQILHKLATRGLLERRTDVRRQAAIPISVKQELSGAELEKGMIVDYSSEGIRIQLASPKEIGQRLLVHCSRDGGESVAVPVRTLWQRDIDKGCEVGCCFLNKGGYELIQRIDLSKNVESTKHSRKTTGVSLRLSGVWLVGLVAILGLCFLGSLDDLSELISWWTNAFKNGTAFDFVKQFLD